MANRQYSTRAPLFHRPERPFAPARILSTEELLALLDSPANPERTFDQAIARLDAIALDQDDADLEHALLFGGRA